MHKKYLERRLRKTSYGYYVFTTSSKTFDVVVTGYGLAIATNCNTYPVTLCGSGKYTVDANMSHLRITADIKDILRRIAETFHRNQDLYDWIHNVMD